jgi:hypothetical protein
MPTITKNYAVVCDEGKNGAILGYFVYKFSERIMVDKFAVTKDDYDKKFVIPIMGDDLIMHPCKHEDQVELAVYDLVERIPNSGEYKECHNSVIKLIEDMGFSPREKPMQWKR